MTGLRFYTDDGLHEWENLQYYHSTVPVVLRCNSGNLTPFCLDYDTTGATITAVVVEYLDGSELTLDDTSDFVIQTDGSLDWITYNGEAVESGGVALDTGLARLRIEMSDGIDWWSDYFQICDLDITLDCGKTSYDNYFNLYFSAEHDLPSPYNVVYQSGYENHHVFDSLPVRPDSVINIEGETDEAQDEAITYQAQKKTYHVEILGGESLFDMLATLPVHEYVYVKWPCHDLVEAKSITFEYEWIADYLCRMTISFSIECVKNDSCDNNYDIIYTGANYFLPSRWELYAMYDNLHNHGVGDFEDDEYWSSSENNATQAIIYDFSTGFNTNETKDSVNRVRCATRYEATGYSLRDVGRYGGLIFYIDGDMCYEAAEEDADSSAWSNIINVLVGTGIDIGTGPANTTAITNQAGHIDSAANSC